MVEYTNASFIVNDKYSFDDGLFSGYDRGQTGLRQKPWAFETDENGIPKKDKTLQDPRCVFHLMKKHYDRTTPDTVSNVSGVSKENLLKVYDAYGATGAGRTNRGPSCTPWVGPSIRSVCRTSALAAILQLLLGNIGVAGGGINALRGEPNVQGSTDHCLLWHILPGYLPCPRPPGRHWPITTRPTRPSATTLKAPIGGKTNPSIW